MVKHTLVFLGLKQARVQKILAWKGLKQKFISSRLARLENILARLGPGWKKQAWPTSTELNRRHRLFVVLMDMPKQCQKDAGASSSKIEPGSCFGRWRAFSVQSSSSKMVAGSCSLFTGQISSLDIPFSVYCKEVPNLMSCVCNFFIHTFSRV